MEELSQTASTWSKTVLIIAKRTVCLEVFNHFLPKDSFENFDNMRGEGYWSIISWDGLTVFFVKRNDTRQFVGSRGTYPLVKEWDQMRWMRIAIEFLQFLRSVAGISSGPEAAFWSILSIAAIMSSIVNSMNSSAKGTWIELCWK